MRWGLRIQLNINGQFHPSEIAHTWFNTGGTTPLSRQSRELGMTRGGGGGRGGGERRGGGLRGGGERRGGGGERRGGGGRGDGSPCSLRRDTWQVGSCSRQQWRELKK